jgi:hypothetical protein
MLKRGQALFSFNRFPKSRTDVTVEQENAWKIQRISAKGGQALFYGDHPFGAGKCYGLLIRISGVSVSVIFIILL